MPPKAKFTREEIAAAALSIIREKGVGALTARELGTRLGSSSRPVFTVFSSMQEVLGEAVGKAKAIYLGYVERGLLETLPFKGVGTEYICFAQKEPKLFQLLFMTEKGDMLGVNNILPVIDDSFGNILKSVQEPYHLDQKNALRLYQHLWIYTHGIAALCATGVCSFSDEEIDRMMTEVFVSILKEIKAEGKGECND